MNLALNFNFFFAEQGLPTLVFASPPMDGLGLSMVGALSYGATLEVIWLLRVDDQGLQVLVRIAENLRYRHPI